MSVTVAGIVYILCNLNKKINKVENINLISNVYKTGQPI